MTICSDSMEIAENSTVLSGWLFHTYRTVSFRPRPPRLVELQELEGIGSDEAATHHAELGAIPGTEGDRGVRLHPSYRLLEVSDYTWPSEIP